jgi:2-polyprenyl-6-methoxyphenol hydroxylase-like FAD-dependent oxidoreductase
VSSPDVPLAIVGGGIAGLALALNLHARGLPCRVYEQAPEIRELGVGITLLPHAMRELAALGLDQAMAAQGIENVQSMFCNRFGQTLLTEPRGRFAGYPYPEIGLNRGKLHATLYRAVLERLGPEAVVVDHRCVAVEQDAHGVRASFVHADGRPIARPVRAGHLVACDGINSAVRRTFYPDETVAFSGVNTWRGVTRRPPILDGRTYFRIGSFLTGNIILYPIGEDAETGEQFVNWVAQIPAETANKNDWNKEARAEDFSEFYRDWVYDWLDVHALVKGADSILEYPMVDKDPVDRWTFGRITLVGDAAHPMYPRGSNGSAQALIDARVLADHLAQGGDPSAAFAAYEAIRRPVTAAVVEANRSTPPDYVNIRVQELTGDRPFENLDDFISQEELRALSDRYKQVAGFSLGDLDAR